MIQSYTNDMDASTGDNQASPLYTKTQLGPFNLVTVVSQGAINANMRLMFKQGSILNTFKVTIGEDPSDPDSSVDATMYAPSISLTGKDGGTSLTFTLNFQDGTFMYYSGSPHNPKKNTIPMTKWTFVFDVSLDKQNIDDLPQTIKDKVKNWNSYGITQLLIDFTTAQLDNFDAAKSNLPGLDPAGVSSLTDCITAYLKQVEANNGNILGYALTATDNTDPTLPPTDCKFQVIPYYDNNNNPVAASNNNTLAWLEVTQKRSLPPQILQWSANLLTPDDPTTNGTMFVCKPDFWDSYLTQKLEGYHRMILNAMNDTMAWLNNKGSPPNPAPWYLSATNPIGDATAQASFDKANPWRQSSSSAVQYTTTVPTTVYKYTSWGTDYSYTTNITNTMTCGAPGTNTVTITTNANCHMTTWAEPYTTLMINDVYLTPTYTLTFTPDADGSIGVATTVSDNAITCKCALGGTVGWYNKDGVENDKTLSNQYTAIVQQNPDLTNGVTSIEAMLNSKNKFVFAGDNDFSFKTTNFNAEGDMVATVFFNSQ